MAIFSMRKLKVSAIAGLAALLVIGLSMLVYNHMVPTVIASKALIIGSNSIEELEEYADLIMVVTVIRKGRQEELEAGTYIFNTFTPVQVKQVFKGDVNPGDIIEIAEPFGYIRTPFELYLYTIEGYLPMQQNSTYLLFITKSASGWLRTTGVYQGKYVWPLPKTISARSLEVGELSGDYLVLFEEVVAKYGQSD